MNRLTFSIVFGPLLGLLAGLSFPALGMAWGVSFGLGCGGLFGFILSRREMPRRVWLTCVGIMTFSLGASGYLYWIASGPVAGDMRSIEVAEAYIVQRAESRRFGPNVWADYQVTPKHPRSSD